MTDTERKLTEYLLYIAGKVYTGTNQQCPICGFYVCAGMGCILRELKLMLEEEN